MMPSDWEAFMEANPFWWLRTKFERKLAQQGLISQPIPIEHSRYILTYGKKAYREWVAAGCRT